MIFFYNFHKVSVFCYESYVVIIAIFVMMRTKKIQSNPLRMFLTGDFNQLTDDELRHFESSDVRQISIV